MSKEVIRIGQLSIRFLIESGDSDGALAMFEFTVPVGAKVPVPHYHKEYDETIYGLEGVLTFTVDGKGRDIGPGESCFIPRGAVHGFTNLKQTVAKVLAVVTPALIGSEIFCIREAPRWHTSSCRRFYRRKCSPDGRGPIARRKAGLFQ
jgi:quercetin dioxygenase-like cupin family protein